MDHFEKFQELREKYVKARQNGNSWIAEQHKKQCINHLEKAAQGDTRWKQAALYQMAIYKRGYDFTVTSFGKPDIYHQSRESTQWLTKAAEQGHVEAMFYLGWAYMMYPLAGKNFYDLDVARKWLELAYRNRGVLSAQCDIYDQLSYLYLNTQEWDKMISLLEEIPADRLTDNQVYRLRKAYSEKGLLQKELALLEKLCPKEDQALRSWQFRMDLVNLYGKLSGKDPAMISKRDALLSKLADRMDIQAMSQWFSVLKSRGDYGTLVKVAQRGMTVGNPVAGEAFRECLRAGKGITPQEAVRWLEGYAAIDSEKWALRELGLLYLDGTGVEKDPVKGFQYLSKAKAKGLKTIQLADCYAFGRGTFADYSKALELYEEYYKDFYWMGPELRTAPGYAWCNYQLKRYTEALPQLTILAQDKANEAWVFDALARCHINGWGFQNGTVTVGGKTVARSEQYAVELLNHAVSRNYAESMNMLGWCYYNGRGVAKNYTQAFRWFEKAEKLAHSGGMMFNLGICYETGNGVAKDLEKAHQWYMKAKAKGNAGADVRLKAMQPQLEEYRQSKELEEAAKRFQKAAEELKESVDNLKNNRTAPPKTEKTPPPKPAVATGEARRELEDLIGLDSVKKEITTLENMIKVNARLVAQGIPPVEVAKHMVFTGNSGTGKTTVARIVAQILKENGILSKGQLVETNRGGLVGEYIGHTDPKTRAKVKEAIGGVLFIDEAYSLIPEDDGKDFGPEAVAALLTMMEDHKDDLVVIVAGYKDEMKRFIDSNPGLKSRFATYIDFPDYTPEEMQQIFERTAKKNKRTLAKETKPKLMALWEHSRNYKNNGNGRAVRKVFEKTLLRQVNRIVRDDLQDNLQLRTIVAEDIPEPEEVFQ